MLEKLKARREKLCRLVTTASVGGRNVFRTYIAARALTMHYLVYSKHAWSCVPRTVAANLIGLMDILGHVM